MTSHIHEVLIIGGGPPGLAAALVLARTKRHAVVFDSQEYRNEGIQYMHTVPSRDHFHPYEFRSIARDQMSRYGTISFQITKVITAAQKELEPGYIGFELTDTEKRTWLGRKLVLATGSKDVLPNIEGYRENWPQHIYQCLGCDGFEQSGTPIGILGFPDKSYGHLTLMAFAFDPRVTIFSNGHVSTDPEIQAALKMAKARGAKLDERRVKRLVNNGPSHEQGVTIEFEEGQNVTLEFLVDRPPLINRAQDLIEQLGIKMGPPQTGGLVELANPIFNETNVPGCFVAGDTMAMIKQVTVAMAEGARAGGGVAFQLCTEEGQRALAALEKET